MVETATAYRSLMLFQKSHRLSKLSAAPLESSCIIFDDVAFPTISKNYSNFFSEKGEDHLSRAFREIRSGIANVVMSNADRDTFTMNHEH
jgi:hypothetical protein